jgi:hypothetical protein
LRLLNKLPLPMYVMYCAFISLSLLYASIKRRNKDRMGIIVVYLTVSIMTSISIIARVVNDDIELRKKYYDFFAELIIILLIIVFVELFFLTITHKGSAESKKKIIIGWIILFIPIIAGLILFLVLK